MKEKKLIADWGNEGVSAAAAFISDWEGLRLEAYKPVDSEENWTIGYGHSSPKVKPGDRIDEITAFLWLDADIKYFQTKLASAVTVPVTLTQSTALLSLVYNIGLGAFKRSTLRKELNAGRIVNASYEFLKWNRGGGVELPGLNRRRRAEKALFMDGV